MKFTLSWLKEFLDTNANIDEICETLTSIGLEVEEVENFGKTLKPFTVAEILETEPHPDADRLKVCKVDVGEDKPLQIVCGAPNARKGIKIPYAKVDSIIPTNGMKIKPSKIRGVESNGMLCSASELGVAEDSEGILELPEASEVGKSFAEFIGKDDCLIDIAITPNRGDCLGVYGIARDLAAAGIGTLKEFKIEKASSAKFESPIKVNIEDENLCPWFIGVYIKDVKNGESPEWLKSKLTSIGKKSISALVDITNYLTFTFGRPAHIYDADKIEGSINVRKAKTGEKITALDEEEYSLRDDLLVISDDKNPVGIAGVIGGLESGCTEETKNAFLEIALFDDIAVSKAGRVLQIDSDARYRFERKVDPESHNLTSYALKLINEICGGENSEIVIAGTPSKTERNISVNCEEIRKITSLDISNNRISEILESLEFEKLGSNNFKIPSFRTDIEILEDIAEEILRLEGFDKLPDIKFSKSIEASDNKKILTSNQKRKQNVRRALASTGYDEVVSFSFCSRKQAMLFSQRQDNLIEIANPISSDLSIMRPSLLPNLLVACEKNLARNIESLSFFEQGGVFSKNEQGEFNQSQSIAGINVGIKSKKTAIATGEDFDVYSIKSGCEEALKQYINPENLKIEENQEFGYYHPGKSGIYKLGNKLVAVFGEIHPSVTKAFDIKKPVFGFEIFEDNLPPAKNKKTFSKGSFDFSNFQPVERDFAFLFDKEKTAQDILTAVKRADKKFIKTAEIFDIYEGEKLGKGKKSVAVKVILQPTEDTFTDQQIEEISNSIITAVEKNTGGALRG